MAEVSSLSIHSVMVEAEVLARLSHRSSPIQPTWLVASYRRQFEGLNGDRRELSIWYRPRIPQFFRIVARQVGYSGTHIQSEARHAEVGLRCESMFAAVSSKNDSHLTLADKGRDMYFLQNFARVPGSGRSERRSGRRQEANPKSPSSISSTNWT
jgi:hypothetical protein